ncbi:hypothetical protein LWI28_005903 [Acer negundo]|uniref:Uncharacterized protein n=1 Tax=Acer negundo TaxID=4023 RepID=A0AAD5ID75_ACENE|nr:hypothetical protein LWI28_005903 [Acer negundo]
MSNLRGVIAIIPIRDTESEVLSKTVTALVSSLNRRLLDLALSHLTFFVAVRNKIDAGRSHLKSFLTSAVRFY